MQDQVDYRADPSFGGDIAQEHIAGPLAAPEYGQTPGLDHTIVAYDLPDEPHDYNLMGNEGAPPIQGWSPG